MPFWRGHVAVRDGTCPIALTPIVHYTLDEPVGHVYDSGVIRQSAANIAERRFTAYCRYRKMLILRRAHAFLRIGDPSQSTKTYFMGARVKSRDASDTIAIQEEPTHGCCL